MKLRTTGRSIRLRLAQTELSRFVETGVIEETIAFGNSNGPDFGYRLVRNDQDRMNAGFDNGILTITIPAFEADTWCSTDQTGIEATVPNGTPQGLLVQIEKDFACLTPRSGDDDRDTFPNPAAARAC